MKKRLMSIVAAVIAAFAVCGVSAQDVSEPVLNVPAPADSAYEPAVRVPDEEDILAKTMDSASPWYYPPIMIRYMAGDLSLTADDYYYLYYGFAYDDAYDAHANLPGENTILEMFADGVSPGREQARAMLDAAKENMLVDPFNPGNINMMTFAYNLLNDTINEIISADRFSKVLAAIKSSGTGAKENSPLHVLRFTHANDVVASMGYTIDTRTVESRTVEYIRFTRNQGLKGMYFDFGRVYWNPYDGPAVKPKNRWQLNGIPL